MANLDTARIPERNWPHMQAWEIMSKQLVVGHPGESLFEALDRMNHANISHLPIVDDVQGDKMIGFLALHDISNAYGLRHRTTSKEHQ